MTNNPEPIVQPDLLPVDQNKEPANTDTASTIETGNKTSGAITVKFDNSGEYGPLLLSKITGISPLNPRITAVAQTAVDPLTTSLEIVGQLNPIVLRKNKDGTLEVLCGSRRYRRILNQRGKDGVLQSHEYRIVTCSDVEAIRMIADENNARRDFSTFELSLLLLKAKGISPGIKQEVLAEQFGIDRPTVSDLLELANEYNSLPKEWQEDLAKVSSAGEEAPRIRFSHYRAIRGKLKGKNKISVKQIMRKAYANSWSVAELHRQLEADGIKTAKPKADGKTTQDNPTENTAMNPSPDDKPDTELDTQQGEHHVPSAEVDYQAVATQLEEVINMVSGDQELHKGATKLLKLVMARTKEVEQKKAA